MPYLERGANGGQCTGEEGDRTPPRAAWQGGIVARDAGEEKVDHDEGQQRQLVEVCDTNEILLS